MIRGAGRYSTLITPTAGSLFHAEFQFGQATFTGTHGNEGDAPIPARRGLEIERQNSGR